MAGAKLKPSRWPGVYHRGAAAAFEWTDANGKRRRGAAPDVAAARRLKAEREDEARQGIAAAAVPAVRGFTVARYARELFGCDLDRPRGIEPLRGRYQGRRTAVRADTITSYRRHLELHVLPTLGARKIATVDAVALRRLFGDLAARDGDAYLADATLRRIFAATSALIGSAVDDGLVAHNPARDVKVPSGRDELRRFEAQDDDGDEGDGERRAMTREQLATFLGIVDPRWRLFFDVLASTGLRVSEGLGLRWEDLALNGATPRLRVRRAYVNGTFGPPKSRHGRRTLPLALPVADALRARRSASEWGRARDLVFPSTTGTPMSAKNLARRTLIPAVQEAGVSWARFHTFRHTVASMLFADGRNVVQVSRWLGHHSAGFTLSVYGHLLDEGVGDALDVPAMRELLGTRTSRGVDVALDEDFGGR